MEQLARFHFQTVHFPIALSFTALFLIVVGLLSKKEKFFISGRIILYLATLGALVAMTTGLMAEEYLPHSHAGEIRAIMEWHETLGITIVVSLVVISLLAFLESRKPSQTIKTFISILLIVLVGAVGFTGYLGGRLGHEFGVGIKKEQPAQQPIEQPVDKHEGHEHHDHSH
ncbi:MAG: DUF2231 domain-containing protein [Deltaproteobacteria bacterium]|nr:DUF2231 domain-containing protein [Deltaproteobacteria bacterium]